MAREKVREKSLFSKPRNCQGFLTSVREFFNLSQNQEILKNRFIKCSDGPMIDYNRKSVGLAFRLR